MQKYYKQGKQICQLNKGVGKMLLAAVLRKAIGLRNSRFAQRLGGYRVFDLTGQAPVFWFNLTE